ncbi:hypothetical protein M5D96_006713 [Drosophila gunungcola]|uniref:Uncharacterized protein n=1 Tax=Drosophila gunungcola TaxID=103775 RepID=A0A9P9YQ01_9MUSC|nr:hypothetical protein M5D96_006713 [Drosophila gunungcola]
MENSMKIANKFSHFHSAPRGLCVMFTFYGFRPQCVCCNNYTTQSTQKEPRVGISHNRCRKKGISSLAVLHKFHNLQISHVFGQKLGGNEQWPMVSKHSRSGKYCILSFADGRRWINI